MMQNLYLIYFVFFFSILWKVCFNFSCVSELGFILFSSLEIILHVLTTKENQATRHFCNHVYDSSK